MRDEQKRAIAWRVGVVRLLKEKSGRLTTAFERLPPTAKRASLVVFGAGVALICVKLIINALHGDVLPVISIEPITRPNDIYVGREDTTLLRPLGQFRGEVDGVAESFVLAVDQAGQLFINRDQASDERRFVKTPKWERISRTQLSRYKEQLHFFSGKHYEMSNHK